MKNEEMRCKNCIFIEKYHDENSYKGYCHLEPRVMKDLERFTCDIKFPTVSTMDWCGQGEWEGPDKDNPDIKVLYRWGEWDN
jgi:hypothetical protein